MRAVFLTAVVFSAFASLAGEPEPRWAVLNHAARKAIENKDYASLRSTLAELWPLMPGNPRVLYNMAASDAMLGNRDRATEELGNLASAGLIYDLSADDDFKNLRDLPKFEEITRQMQRNRDTVARATAFQTLTERDSLPEDIAYDSKKHVFLVSSVSGSKITRIDGDTLATATWSVMAMRIDQKRRILWASIAWLPHCKSCRPEDKDKTAIVEYQLDSGVLLGRFDSPLPGMFGDMTIGKQGELYLSEGIHGAVLRFARGKFERLDTAGEFPSPQTPALSADERTLYVPDYVRGIGAIDVKTRAVRWLEPAAGVILSGIDGLYVYRHSFIAVQNGTNPARVVQFSLDLKRQEILEANAPGLGEPTHGTLVGDVFYFLANTGWSEYGDDGKKKAGSLPVVSSIRKIDLRREGLR